MKPVGILVFANIPSCLTTIKKLMVLVSIFVSKVWGAVNSSEALRFANLIAAACSLADEFRYKGYVVEWNERKAL